MSRAGTTGMTKILSFLRGYFAKDSDVIKTVNNQHADTGGNLDLKVVPAAQQIVTDDGKTEMGTFVERTTGGDDSIGDGQVDVMQIRGNAVHTGVVQESITMTVQMTTRQEGEEEITATLDEDTFKAAVNASGTYTMTYTTEWSTDPSTYGVTVEGTPIAGDTITIVYVMGDRGTITVATPSAFRETGWNLYNHTLGYARVLKYASSAIFAIAGSYTALQFSETISGTKTDVGVSSGYFTIAKDGYIWVTGGNSTDTEIYMCWTDWVNGHTGVAWEAYTEDVLDISGIMSSCFPYGLLAVKGVYDEINFTDQKVVSRVTRTAYTEEAAAAAAASGRKWDADSSYIYLERATPIETDLESILDEYDSDETYDVGELCWYDGKAMRCIVEIAVAEAWNAAHWKEARYLTANDHGMEAFDDTTVGTTILVLYGENLVDKLRRDLPEAIANNSDAIAKIITDQTNPTDVEPYGFIGRKIEGGGTIFFDYALGFKGDVTVNPITSNLHSYHVDRATGLVVCDDPSASKTNRFYVVSDYDIGDYKHGTNLMWSKGTAGTLYTLIGTQTGFGTGYSNTELCISKASTDGILEWNSDAYNSIWHYIWKGDWNSRSPKWFLPSKDELNVLLNMQWQTASKRKGYNQQTSAWDIQLPQLPINFYSYYWSSSESSATVAHIAHFYDGNMTTNNKNNANIYHARLVRTF